MDSLELITSVSAFIAVLAVVYCGYTAFRGLQPDETYDKLREMVEHSEGRSKAPSLLKESTDSLENVAKALRGFAKAVITLNNLFEQAGVSFSTKGFFGLSLLTAITATATAVLAKVPGPLCPLAFLGGAISPFLWLVHKRRRRFARFANQLPEAFQTMARALRAGHGLPSAISIVSQEMLPPIAAEFRRVADEQSLGRSLDESLEQLADRVPNDELQFFATSVKLQQRCGGNLAEILDKICSIVRERARILGQVHALTGEGRLSGTILLAMPFVLFVVVYYLSPHYVEPLFKDGLGKKMTAVALVLQLIGAVVIRRIVRINV